MPPEDNSAASLGIILLLVHTKSGQTFQTYPLNNRAFTCFQYILNTIPSTTANFPKLPECVILCGDCYEECLCSMLYSTFMNLMFRNSAYTLTQTEFISAYCTLSWYESVKHSQLVTNTAVLCFIKQRQRNRKKSRLLSNLNASDLLYHHYTASSRFLLIIKIGIWQTRPSKLYVVKC